MDDDSDGVWVRSQVKACWFAGGGLVVRRCISIGL